VLEAAWLVTQFTSHSGDYVSLQYALGDLMAPRVEPTNFANADGTTVAQWLALAAANYGQINPANFMIITNTGTFAYTGQVQEFIVQTTEPATVVLLLFGVVSMFLGGASCSQLNSAKTSDFDSASVPWSGGISLSNTGNSCPN